MEMDCLKCQTPEMVRKELLVHLIAYNLVRTLMFQCALKYSLSPNRISFTIALATINSWAKWFMLSDDKTISFGLHDNILLMLARLKHPCRPFRVEPRVIKKRKKAYPLMTRSRKISQRKNDSWWEMMQNALNLVAFG